MDRWGDGPSTVSEADSWTRAVIAALLRQRRSPLDHRGDDSDEFFREIDRVRRGELPRRPARRYHTHKVIAAFHGLPLGECWRCRRKTDYLERAHIIDRWADGLDGPQNIALLCEWCHRGQPIFRPGDEDEAARWVGIVREAS